MTEDYEALGFNTAISQMMVFINEGYKQEKINQAYVEGFVKMLSPIAPHIAEELWQKLGHTETITYAAWPAFDESKLVDDEVEIVIQINGKLKKKAMIQKICRKKNWKHLRSLKKKLKQRLKVRRYAKSSQYRISSLTL